MSTFVHDNFTDAAGTLLSAHVGEVGATWSGNTNEGAGPAVITPSGTLRPVSSGGVVSWMASGAPGSDDYSVSVVLAVKSLRPGDVAGIKGRGEATVGTEYIAYYTHGQGYLIYRFVGGSYTQLGSTYAATAVDGDVLTLVMSGTAISALLNGTTIIGPVTDATLAGPGLVGLFLYSASEVGDDVGVHLDSVTAMDGSPTGPTKQVFFGVDSISYGAYASSGQGTVTGTVYPAVVMAALGSDWKGHNYGISGQAYPPAQAGIAAQVSAHVDPSITDRVACVLGATNDLLGGDSVQAIFDREVAYHQSLQALGIKTVMYTTMPANPSATIPAGTYARQDAADFNPAADALNTLRRANWQYYAHALADIAADNRLDYRVQPGNFGDQTHPDDAGYAVLAGIAAPQVLNALASTGLAPIPAAPVITSPATATLSAANRTFQPAATGSPTSWSYDGSLPSDVSFDAATGEFSYTGS